MREKDIIVLEGGHRYCLVKQLDYDNEVYFYASAADENNKIIDNRNLIFRLVKEEEDNYIEPVTDKKILTELVRMIKGTIK